VADSFSQRESTIERLRRRQPWVPWETYLSATLSVLVEGVWEELYAPGLGYRVALLTNSLRTPIGIITAWNPQGRPASEQDNREDDVALHAIVLDVGGKVLRARGSSEESGYHEDGWAVSGLSLRYLSVLSCRFRQIAFYWCTASSLWCVTADLSEWLVVDTLPGLGG
jgi:hypothetical protein